MWIDKLSSMCLSRVNVLKRIPKSSRTHVAAKLTCLLNDVTRAPDSVKAWCSLFGFPRICLKAEARGGRNRRLTTLAEKCNRYSAEDFIAFNPPRMKKQQKPPNRDIAKTVQGKIEEFDVKGAVRAVSSSDSLADCSDAVAEEMRVKHPQGRAPTVSTSDATSATTTPGKVRKQILSFPAGSAGGPDLLRPQILKDLTAESNGEAAQRLLLAMTNFCNMVLSGTVPPPIRPFFFGANLFALGKKSGGYRPIAVGNTLRRLVAKCAGEDVTSARKQNYGNYQLGYNTPRGAETAAHTVQAYTNSSDISDKHVLLKIDFENAFNTVDRQVILDTIRDKHPSIYHFTSCCYGQKSHLFFGDKVLSSEVGPQQGDPEAPPLFCDAIIDHIQDLSSRLNAWYLDDGQLADLFDVVLQDLRRVQSFAGAVGLRLNPAKCEIIFLGEPDDRTRRNILQQFNDVCPGIKETPIVDLEVLGAPIGQSAQRRVLAKKTEEFETLASNLKLLDAHTALFLLRNCFSIPKVLYYLRSAACFKETDLLQQYDDIINSTLESITNVHLTNNSIMQARQPDHIGGLGIPSAVQLAPSAFLASRHGCEQKVIQILGAGFAVRPDATDAYSTALEMWKGQTRADIAPANPSAQRSWTSPVHAAISQSLKDSLEANDQARLSAAQGSVSSAWLRAYPSINLGLKLNNKQTRVAMALRLGCKVCETHTCVCGQVVQDDGLHGLSCKRSAGRMARHSTLNDIVKRALVSAEVPSVLEPNGLLRRDGKRPDGMTLVPWSRGRCLLWDVTVVDALAPSRIGNYQPTKAAAEAERRKEAKYSELSANGYVFQPVAFEAQGNCGPSSLQFLQDLGKRIIRCTNEPNAKQFLFQRISIAIQMANVACVLGTVETSRDLEEIFMYV
jgi:hypothetical protein